MKTKRTVLRIVYFSSWWFLKAGSMVIDAARAQCALLAWKHVLRDLWESHALPGQLIVHRKDGRILREYTYGRDPKRRTG